VRLQALCGQPNSGHSFQLYAAAHITRLYSADPFLQQVQCLLNVARNCVKERCSIDPVGGHRLQDADKADDITVPAVTHHGEMKCVVLTTTLISSAHLLWHLYGPVHPGPTLEVIARRATKRLAADAAAKAAKKQEAAEKAADKQNQR
jgi:hypothetical protein